MPRLAKPLSDKEIKQAKPKAAEYGLSDGNGLILRIRPTGSKTWMLNYIRPYVKTRTNFTLGSYPEVSLAQARKKALEARELLAQGIDPKQERGQQAAEQAALVEHTFERVAADWFAIKKESVTEGHANATWKSLERIVLPAIGKLPISQITAPLMIQTLKPTEARGSLETVKRVTQRVNDVMTFAVNTGLIHANPLAGIKAAFKKPKKEHMPALSPNELPELVNAINHANIKKVTRCLIYWQLHTMLRPKEAALAKWENIDLNAKLWSIPSQDMKMKRPHEVPLTDELIEILDILRPISGHLKYLFPSDINPQKRANEQTVNMALKRMGFAGRTTAHGLRSLASSTLNEQGFDADVVEAALAHIDKNQVRSAYNRTTYLERRRVMMAWWSQHIVNALKPNVIYPNAWGA